MQALAQMRMVLRLACSSRTARAGFVNFRKVRRQNLDKCAAIIDSSVRPVKQADASQQITAPIDFQTALSSEFCSENRECVEAALR